MKPLRDKGIFGPHESAVAMHPYRPQMLMKELGARFFWPLAMLSKLARAMLYLVSYSPTFGLQNLTLLL